MKIMRRNILAILAAAALIFGYCSQAAAAPKGWEPAKSEYATAKQVVKEMEFEIKVIPGVIMVNTGHPIQIKIFTILGRLVNSETLPAGTSRFTLPAHGVYIVKIGDFTCKIAV